LNKTNSIILIGMPGVGKSTLGILLAKETAKDFVDTDVLIQLKESTTLQEIINKKGHETLRHIEEAVLLETSFPNHIVATGGSAVYSDAGMKRLKTFGNVIFLDLDLESLKKRIHNYETRGIAKKPDQTFDELFNERKILYQKYADITINCFNKTVEETLKEICSALEIHFSTLK